MKTFRGKRLIDREKEIKFIKTWFEEIPDEILWIYGPKSSGKTTIIEYIVEHELFEDFWTLKPKGDFWVRYINLRGKLITSYNSFLESFLKSKEQIEDTTEKLSSRISIGIFTIKGEKLRKIKEKNIDLFDAILSEIQDIAKKKTPIIIIDEIQTLEDIYINSNRDLLKEFLNFCVRLTKELHLSHVTILSSNTIFIDRIYNDARLKKTSKFYKIDYLDKDTTKNWLKEEGFNEEDIELIWEYLGGDIAYIQKMIREKDEFPSLKDYLKYQQQLAYSEIVDLLTDEKNFEKRRLFKEIAKEIILNGSFKIREDLSTEKKHIINHYVDKEILFLDPLTREVKGNNRLYEKGMELLVYGNKL
ncbi:ATP-binding protein [Desulfothermus okinawensis JCM 13304]